MNKFLRVTMPDHSQWDVPVSIIARNRAKEYADEFDGDVERSLTEDTLPVFEEDDYEIQDWAANNMNWRDVKQYAIKVQDAAPMTEREWEDGWCNGEKEFVWR